MKNKMKRPIALLLCLITVIAVFPGGTALAASKVTIDSENNSGFDYFEYYNANGQWVDLNTPKHTISETGQVAYCIQHKLGNPHGVGYSETDPLDSYSTRTVRGIQIILENGYPCNTNGFTADQARQATANAIRFWLSEEGADSQWNFTNRREHPNSVRAKSGYQSLLNWADELLQLARNQQPITHRVTFSPSSMELKASGNYFVGTTKVTLVNCSGGYTLDKSGLPSGSAVEGFTGNNGDTLTIKIPKQYGNRTIQIDATGYDNRTSANLFWYAPNSGNYQKLVTYSSGSFQPTTGAALRVSTPAFGKIELVKKSEDGKLLPGVVFGIYSDSACKNLVARLITGSNGRAVSGDLELSTFYLKEISAVSPYVLSDTVYPVTVRPSETVTVNAVNEEAKGQIKITKTNANPAMGDYSLAGSVFDIYSGDTVVASVTVDASGKGISSPIKLGSYVVKERQASSGFVLNKQEYPVTLSYEGQTVPIVYGEVTIPNTPQAGRITVTKADTETGDKAQGDASLFGARYEIKDKNGKVVDTLHALGSRVVTSKELPLGTYTVKEIPDPPTGYLLNPNPATVTLSYGGQNVSVVTESATIEDQVIKGRIELTKFGERELDGNDPDPDVKPALAGVQFEVRLKSSGELYDTITTGENGRGVSNLLPYGVYVVTELRSEANEGYKLIAPFEVFVCENEKTYSYILEDKSLEMMIRLVKQDAESGHTIPVAGTTFRIENSKGEAVTFDMLYPQPHTLSEFQTDSSGTLYLPNTLPTGTYKLFEVSAPEPYLLNNEPVTFTVSEDNAENGTVTVTMKDTPVKGTISIEKKGEMLVGHTTEETKYGVKYIPKYELQGLDGVVYEVFAAENIGVPGKVYHKAGEKVCELTTKNGKAASEPLYLGKYVCKEKSTNSGFVLDTAEYEVTLSYADQHTALIAETLTQENQRQKAVVELLKNAEYFDPNTGGIYTDYGEGFVFGLYTKEAVGDIPANALLDILVTDKDGKAQSTADIPLTKLYLKELATPHGGYAVSSALYPVDATSKNDTDEAITDDTHSAEPIHNELITKRIQVTKVDKNDSDRTLAGAVFEIADAESTAVIGLIEIGEDGTGISGELPILREFILREKTAPVGFCLSKEEIRFTLKADSDDIVRFTFENKPTEVIIEKTDVTTGDAVPGAGITVYDDATDEVMFEGETNSDGCVIIHELPTGKKYRFVESYSPDGFAMNKSEFFFEVDEYGNITGDTEITDEPISVIVEKKNAYDGSPMSGVVFSLRDEDGNAVKVKATGNGYFVPDESEGSERFAVDENGKAEIRYLKAGNYTLVEDTPAGFVSAGTYELTITNENGVENPYQATITNSPTALKICKVHADTKKPLTGAGFTLKVKDGLGFKTLTFTKAEDGKYILDEKEKATELMVNDSGELVVIGVPLGEVWIEESVVPAGFFPNPAYKVTMTEDFTFEVPFETTIENTPSVKLGIDSDKYNVLIAIGIALLGVGVVTWRVAAAKKAAKKKKIKED